VRSLARILQRDLLETWLPLLTPGALGTEHNLRVLPLLAVALSDEVVNEQCAFVLPFELVLCKIADCIKGLLLDALEDLIFGLVILANGLDDLRGVGFPPSLKLLERAHIELLLLDSCDDLAVEKDHLPLVLVEALREVLEPALSQVLNVLG